jgi:hypothetical protein
MATANGSTAIGDPSNDGAATIELSTPYVARAAIEGTCPLLFHRWSCDDIEAKAKATKGSAGKRRDNLEAYVWRTPHGLIGLPGEYVRQSIIWAAKFRQDPRSPRKSAMDLYKAAVVALTDVAPLLPEREAWDYVDRRRVTVQRNGVTRQRPAINAGWRAAVDFTVLLPEYVAPMDLRAVLGEAGRLVGVGDFRPTFGRFSVVSFDIGIES